MASFTFDDLMKIGIDGPADLSDMPDLSSPSGSTRKKLDEEEENRVGTDPIATMFMGQALNATKGIEARLNEPQETFDQFFQQNFSMKDMLSNALRGFAATAMGEKVVTRGQEMKQDFLLRQKAQEERLKLQAQISSNNQRVALGAAQLAQSAADKGEDRIAAETRLGKQLDFRAFSTATMAAQRVALAREASDGKERVAKVAAEEKKFSAVMDANPAMKLAFGQVASEGVDIYSIEGQERAAQLYPSFAKEMIDKGLTPDGDRIKPVSSGGSGGPHKMKFIDQQLIDGTTRRVAEDQVNGELLVTTPNGELIRVSQRTKIDQKLKDEYQAAADSSDRFARVGTSFLDNNGFADVLGPALSAGGLLAGITGSQEFMRTLSTMSGNADFQNFVMELQTEGFSVARAISGAAMTDSEQKRILGIMPNTSDAFLKPDVFVQNYMRYGAVQKLNQFKLLLVGEGLQKSDFDSLPVLDLVKDTTADVQRQMKSGKIVSDSDSVQFLRQVMSAKPPQIFDLSMRQKYGDDYATSGQMTPGEIRTAQKLAQLQKEGRL